MSNELMLRDVSSLTNKALVQQVNVINKAIDTMNTRTWSVAKAVHTIIEGELFKDDFTTEENFANYLGISRPVVNKMKRAYIMREAMTDKTFSIGQVQELLPVKPENVELFLRDYEIDSTSTCVEIRGAVECWKDDMKKDRTEEKEKSVSTAEDDGLVSFSILTYDSDGETDKYTAMEVPLKVWNKLQKLLSAYMPIENSEEGGEK